MVLFNYSTKELTAKVVYYGPGLCGKTTNLQYIHQNLPGNVRGKMLSLATKTDRTLFFDFLPIDLGSIRGMKTRVQLYTVPGQVFYNETRKLVLKGADGIVFVADSQEQMLGANVESFRNLEDNLKAHGMNLAEMPHVLQFNKRDLPRLSGIEDLNNTLNRYNAPFYESVATTGIGVQDTLKAAVKLVLLHLTRKYDPGARARHEGVAAPSAPAPPVVAPMPPPGIPPQMPVAVRGEPAGASASTRAIPVSDFETPVDRPQATPVFSMPDVVTPEAFRDGPPPPPDFHGTGTPDLAEPGIEQPEFGDEEIEELVDEVEDSHEEMPAPEITPESPFVEPLAAAGRFEEVSHAEPAGTGAIEGGSGADMLLSAQQDEPTGQPFPFQAPPADRGVGTGRDAFNPDLSAETLFSDLGSEADSERSADRIDDAGLSLSPAEAADAGSDETFEVGESQLEVDRQFDPEWPEDEAPEPAPLDAWRGSEIDDPMTEPEPDASSEEPEKAEILLTEVAGDEDLFEDPDIDVARMAAGEAREILVPVEVGEGAARRRFKLSIRLQLDPIDGDG